MEEKRTISSRAAGVLSPGLQGFLWYLADTVEAERQEFRLEPGKRTQHIRHSRNSPAVSREYDVTVAKSENLISAVLIVTRKGSCSAMQLQEEVENGG